MMSTISDRTCYELLQNKRKTESLRNQCKTSTCTPSTAASSRVASMNLN